MLRSSSGPGRCPFTAETRVRFPYGVQLNSLAVQRSGRLPVTQETAGSNPVEAANRSLAVLRTQPKINIGGIIKDCYMGL